MQITNSPMTMDVTLLLGITGNVMMGVTCEGGNTLNPPDHPAYLLSRVMDFSFCFLFQ